MNSIIFFFTFEMQKFTACCWVKNAQIGMIYNCNNVKYKYQGVTDQIQYKQKNKRVLMQFDTFEYPINNQQIQTHKIANRIGKMRDNHRIANIENQKSRQSCIDCGRAVSQCPKTSCCEKQSILEQRYGVYGPSCAIYLGFIIRIAIFMLICTLCFALPMFIMNLAGIVCSQQEGCTSSDVTYNWSLYNVLGLTPGSLPHTVLWFVFCLFMIAFCIYLRKYVLQTYRRINDRNTTDSDYCLLLRRLPPSTKPEDIRGFIERQVNISNNDTQIKSADRLQGILVRDIIMINKTEDMFKDHKKQVKQFKKTAKQDEKQGRPITFNPPPLSQSVDFANAAIVRFNDKVTNNMIAQSTQVSIKEKILNYLCVFYNPRTQYQIHSTNIALENAPHPTDILWKNMGFSEGSRMMKKIIYSFVAILVLIVSAGVSLGFSFWIQLITNSQGKQPVYLTVIIVLITMTFNLIIMRIVIWTTTKLKLDTRTDQQSEQIMLVVIHQSLNLGFFSIIVPILVKLPSVIADETTKSSSFPLVMFTTIIIQSLITNPFSFIMQYFEVKQRIMRFLHNKKISIKTQTQARNTFKGTEVPFVKSYSFNVKMVWFGFLYGVVSPISVFIAMIGMFLFYFFEKVLFNKRYSIPYYTGPRINYAMIDLLDWTPLLIGLFNLFLYKTSQSDRSFQTDHRILGLIATMIVIGIIHLFVPWKMILKKCIKRKQFESNDQFNPSFVEITYQEANPVMRITPNIIFREGATPKTPISNQLETFTFYGQSNVQKNGKVTTPTAPNTNPDIHRKQLPLEITLN